MDGPSSASFRRVIFHKLPSHQVCCGNFCDICENNLQSLDMKSLTLVLRHESLSWRECWRRFCPGNGLSTRLVILSVLKGRVTTSKGTLILLKFLQLFPATLHFGCISTHPFPSNISFHCPIHPRPLSVSFLFRTSGKVNFTVKFD